MTYCYSGNTLTPAELVRLANLYGMSFGGNGVARFSMSKRLSVSATFISESNLYAEVAISMPHNVGQWVSAEKDVNYIVTLAASGTFTRLAGAVGSYTDFACRLAIQEDATVKAETYSAGDVNNAYGISQQNDTYDLGYNNYHMAYSVAHIGKMVNNNLNLGVFTGIFNLNTLNTWKADEYYTTGGITMDVMYILADTNGL